MYSFARSTEGKNTFLILADGKAVGKALANPYRVYHSTVELSYDEKVSLQLFAKKCLSL